MDQADPTYGNAPAGSDEGVVSSEIAEFALKTAPEWPEILWESGNATFCLIGRVYMNSQTRYIFRTIRGPEDSLCWNRPPEKYLEGLAVKRKFTAGVLFCRRKTSVSIEEKVIGIVSDQLDVPKEEISRDSSFVDDLKADSLDIVELVMALEDEFDVKIPDEDYDKIKTVGNAITYIEGKS